MAIIYCFCSIYTQNYDYCVFTTYACDESFYQKLRNIFIIFTGKSIAENSGVHNNYYPSNAIDGATATYGDRFCGLLGQACSIYFGIKDLGNQWATRAK